MFARPISILMLASLSALPYCSRDKRLVAARKGNYQEGIAFYQKNLPTRLRHLGERHPNLVLNYTGREYQVGFIACCQSPAQLAAGLTLAGKRHLNCKFDGRFLWQRA